MSLLKLLLFYFDMESIIRTGTFEVELELIRCIWGVIRCV